MMTIGELMTKKEYLVTGGLHKQSQGMPPTQVYVAMCLHVHACSPKD